MNVNDEGGISSISTSCALTSHACRVLSAFSLSSIRQVERGKNNIFNESCLEKDRGRMCVGGRGDILILNLNDRQTQHN